MQKQKIVLITGTSSGIGRITSQTLASEGHIVYATMRNTDSKNSEAARSLGDFHQNLHVLELDVTNEKSIQNAISHIIEAHGRIDVLINNAGVMNIGLTEAFTIDELQKQMDVNYFGVARMFKAVLPSMRQRNDGLIITLTSLAGRLTFPAFYSYCSSKYAAEALAEGYRYELKQFNIDSVIIEPGPFGTDLIANSPRPSDENVLKAYGDFAAMPETVINNFDSFIKENMDGADCDSQIVANDVMELMNTPYGKRPLRTVSGLDYGVRALNTANEPFELNVLDAMEMSHLNPNQ